MRRRLRHQLKRAEWYMRRRLSEPVLSRLRGRRFRNLPIAMITGTVGKTTTTKMLAAILTEAGHVTGLADTEGVWIDGQKVYHGEGSGWLGHRFVLKDKRVTAASLETARGGIISFGFYTRNVTAAALLNVGYEHVGTNGLKTLDDILRVKRRVTDTARNCVLNADNAHTLALARAYRPDKVVLFSLHDHNPDVKAHLKRGGTAIILSEQNSIEVTDGGQSRELMKVAELPCAFGGRAQHMVANAMAAAALARLLGVDDRVIARALAGFTGGSASNPGRFTTFDTYDFHLMVTRGVNPASLSSDVPAFKAINQDAARHIIVFAGVGSRPDEHHRKSAAVIAGQFDVYILHDTPYWLGDRKAGNMPHLVRQALLEAGVADDQIHIVPSDVEAFALVAEIAEVGDAVFLCAKLTESEPAMLAAFEGRKLR